MIDIEKLNWLWESRVLSHELVLEHQAYDLRAVAVIDGAEREVAVRFSHVSRFSFESYKFFPWEYSEITGVSTRVVSADPEEEYDVRLDLWGEVKSRPSSFGAAKHP